MPTFEVPTAFIAKVETRFALEFICPCMAPIFNRRALNGTVSRSAQGQSQPDLIMCSQSVQYIIVRALS